VGILARFGNWLALLVFWPGASVAGLFVRGRPDMSDVFSFIVATFFCNWMIYFLAALVFEHLNELRRDYARSREL
jgi:hypothetical protein